MKIRSTQKDITHADKRERKNEGKNVEGKK